MKHTHAQNPIYLQLSAKGEKIQRQQHRNCNNAETLFSLIWPFIMIFFFLWFKLVSPTALTHPPPSLLLNHRSSGQWGSGQHLSNRVRGLLTIDTEFSIKLNVASWPQLCCSFIPRSVTWSHWTNPCKIGQNTSLADIRTKCNDQLSLS